jgi:hypothetical protein
MQPISIYAPPPQHPAALPVRDPRLEALIEMYWPPRRLMGRVFMPDFEVIPDRPLRFFIYPFDFTLAAQQTFQNTQTIGHRFWWWGISGNSSLDQQGNPLPYRVRIHDGRTRQPFQSSSIIAPSLVGSGQLPFFMRRPHCIPYRRPINVQVENVAAALNRVQVCLLGAIYDG